LRRIAHISDIHFGAHDPDAVEALRSDLLDFDYDLLIVSGDLTQRATARQFRAAMDFLESLPTPRLVVPGNHDVPLHDVIRRFISPLGRYKSIVTDDLRPVFLDDEVLAIGMNTARPLSWRWGGFWKDGRINADQLLDIHLASLESPGDRFKVVVTHHPFIPPPGARSHGMIELETESEAPARKVDPTIVHGSGRALRTLSAVGVDILLAGHLHMNYSGDVRSHHEAVQRSILSIQAGTACSHRRRGEPNAYNRLVVETEAHDGLDADRLTVEVRARQDGDFRTDTTRRFVRNVAGWQLMPA
jgi:3',5'-cyclic AMP phosphodiesterase CpdA